TNFPCKLFIEFRNWSNRTMLLRLDGFKLSKDVKPDPKAAQDSTSGLLEIKFIENAAQGESVVMNVDAIIRHAESRAVWVPLDPAQPQDKLEKALRDGKFGTMKAEVLWFDDAPKLGRYRPAIRRI